MDVCVYERKFGNGEVRMVVDNDPEYIKAIEINGDGFVVKGATSVEVKCPPIGAKIYLDRGER